MIYAPLLFKGSQFQCIFICIRAAFDEFIATGTATLYATNVTCVKMVMSEHLFEGYKLVASNFRIDDSEYSNSGT